MAVIIVLRVNSLSRAAPYLLRRSLTEYVSDCLAFLLTQLTSNSCVAFNFAVAVRMVRNTNSEWKVVMKY